MASVTPRINTIRDMDDDAVSRTYARQMGRFQKGYDDTARRAHDAVPGATRILDAATGPALSLPLLTELHPHAEVTALDVSAHMLARARETLERAGVADRVRLVQGSVYQMPFPDGSFDLVIASQLIHMLDDLPRFLSEARRVLAANGTLLVLDFRRDAPAWYRGLARVSTMVLRTLRLPMDGMQPVLAASYTADELRQALLDSGFKEPGVSVGIAALSAEAR